MLLALMITVALACAAAVFLVGSAPANAAKPPPPEPLVITVVDPVPGAIFVPLNSAVVVSFNQELLAPRMVNCELSARVINLNTLEAETVDISCQTGDDGSGVRRTNMVISPPDAGGFFLWSCGTTYEVIVGGKGRSAVKSLDREPISEVPLGVTLDRGVATWTFTTNGCT
jgi:hypothetical protein